MKIKPTAYWINPYGQLVCISNTIVIVIANENAKLTAKMMLDNLERSVKEPKKKKDWQHRYPWEK